MSTTIPVGDTIRRRIVDRLATSGWAVQVDFLPCELVAELRSEALALWADGTFRRAGVGVGESRVYRPEVRTDHVHWLDPATLTSAQREVWDRIEQLRLAINETLLLGLFDYEAHLAVYPAGAFYRKHLDQFKTATERLVTCIVYLNDDDWAEPDGGCLRLYPEPGGGGSFEEVVPQGGTLVCFLAGELWHEVTPARRPRLSLTGWLRRRPDRVV